MSYVVSIFYVQGTEVQRHNYSDLVEAMARAVKASGHPKVRKVEVSVIVHTIEHRQPFIR